MQIDLNGKRAIVTGSTAGIGFAIAAGLAESGATVVINGRSEKSSSAAKERLADKGGYEVVHESDGIEIGVYVLVAPEPDRQQPHEDDEVYVVLEGSGVLDVGDERVDLREGHAVFVPAGAEQPLPVAGWRRISMRTRTLRAF